MALVARLIWRFDYPLAYDYIDRRGAALRVIMTKFDNYFSKASESQEDGITVEHTDDDGRFLMTIDRSNINGALIFNAGQELSRVLNSDKFERANALVNELLALAGVSNVSRAGFRLIFACENKYIPKDDQTVYLAKAPLEPVIEAFGALDDSAVITTGKAADQTSYRLQTGPLRRKNIDQAHEAKTSDANWELFSKYPAMCDIDLYDIDFRLTTTFYKWALPKLQKIEHWVKMVSEDER